MIVVTVIYHKFFCLYPESICNNIVFWRFIPSHIIFIKQYPPFPVSAIKSFLVSFKLNALYKRIICIQYIHDSICNRLLLNIRLVFDSKICILRNVMKTAFVMIIIKLCHCFISSKIIDSMVQQYYLLFPLHAGKYIIV